MLRESVGWVSTNETKNLRPEDEFLGITVVLQLKGTWALYKEWRTQLVSGPDSSFQKSIRRSDNRVWNE